MLEHIRFKHTLCSTQRAFQIYLCTNNEVFRGMNASNYAYVADRLNLGYCILWLSYNDGKYESICGCSCLVPY